MASEYISISGIDNYDSQIMSINSNVMGSDAQIDVMVMDNSIEIVQYEYYLSGTTYMSASSTSSTYTFTGLSPGTYTVTVVVYDRVSHSASKTDTFTVS